MVIYVDMLSVLLSGIIGFVFSYLWYSSFLFGKLWLSLQKKEKQKIKILSLALRFIYIYIISYGIAFLQQYLQVTSFWDGLIAGAVFWFVFVATTHLSISVFEKRNFKLYLLDQAHWLIIFLLMGGVLAG